ncbi:fatty acid 2-hydroxylase isoform X2 [Rhagoletis pomonella]|nr:fatty acid 2-hydroxylase isoform X2 [Rhagoletis pomonella]XP_036334066.1 fatty acid 2-hydroxylase isoform X2 [Rhagoletis pomonella]
MQTIVSDLTLPTTVVTPVAVTATTSSPAATDTQTKLVANGKFVQIGQYEQNSEEENDKYEKSDSRESAEEQRFIVKYRQSYYDITRFLKNHPGGINTLRGLNNGDMTTRFLHAPPHSDAAMYLMKEYKLKSAHLQNDTKREQNLHQRQQRVHNVDLIVADDDVQQQPVFEASASANGIELIANALQEDKNNNQLDESMEHLVDWSKAMLPQISQITRHYDEWVHRPVDRPLRLFGPSYLEMFTKTPWWVIPLFWIPVICKCIWDEFSQNWSAPSTSTLLCILFTSGILFWTLLEYILHRFVFHMKVTASSNPWLCTFHFMIHGLHHKVPFDSKRLVFPPLPGVIIATIIYTPISFLLPHPRAVLAGALFGYLCYDLMHYYLHYGNPSLQHTRFMYDMKRYHYQHHFAHQDMGYGISSPFWDTVFNTRIRLRKLRFPLRWR